MKEENKKRINKILIPFSKRTLSFLTATTMLVTGTVGCKEEDKEKKDTPITSSISQSAVTSSDKEIVVSNNSSSIVEEESKDENTHETTISNSSTTSTSSTNKTSQESSSTNNKTSEVSNSSSSKTNSSSSKVSSSSSSTSSTTQTMPSKLTANNINDVETFKHFAKMFRKELDGDLLRFDDKMTDGVKEFQLMLALMNYEYMNNDTLYKLFHNLSKSELQELSEFISGIVTTVVYKNEQYNYNKYFINKKLGNFMTEVQNNVVTKNNKKLKNTFDKFYFDPDSPAKYGDNFWVDYNVYLTVALTMNSEYDNDDPLIQKNISARVSREVYNEKIVELYKRMYIKVKVKE